MIISFERYVCWIDDGVNKMGIFKYVIFFYKMKFIIDSIIKVINL